MIAPVTRYHRASRTDYAARDRHQAKAYGTALARLRELHRAEFDTIYTEERAKP